jgi:hypothetical protein
VRTVTPLFIALTVGLAGCAPKPEKEPESVDVTPKNAETLAPEDVGVAKYVFEVKVPKDKVMVLRKSERVERNGKVGKPTDVLESIQYTGGGVGRQVVLMFDSSDFPFGDGLPDNVRIRAQAGGMIFAKCRCNSRSIRPGRLDLEISGGSERTFVTYECFLEDYAEAKKRVPTLSDINPGETWTHNHSPK